ncbi:MAG: hypothetical protein QGI86_05245 [Candidatus Poribacteria bacterium]|nr:hypothetical protein [Candidatus Poribacteria bacterium]MDP6748272.1 hypothetical protein [Candidatus Poribacteria bacterium]MDP6995269.1 hypothetical protein [Candidatus Poribacteria bacterium]
MPSRFFSVFLSHLIIRLSVSRRRTAVRIYPLLFILLVNFGQIAISQADGQKSSSADFIVIDVVGQSIYFNLGFEQGVKTGMRFNILSPSVDESVQSTKKGWLIVTQTYADVSQGELQEISGALPEVGDIVVFQPQLSSETANGSENSSISQPTRPILQTANQLNTHEPRLAPRLPRLSINWKRWSLTGVGLITAYLSVKSHQLMNKSIETYIDAMNEGEPQLMKASQEEKKKFDRNRVIYGIISVGLLGYSGYQAFFTNQNHMSFQSYRDNQPNRFFLSPYWISPRSGLQVKKPF